MHGRGETGDLVGLRQVERQKLDRESLPRRLRRDVVPAGLVDVADEDARPLASEQQRGRPADPGSAAGDDECAILHLHRDWPFRATRARDVQRRRRQCQSRRGPVA